MLTLEIELRELKAKGLLSYRQYEKKRAVLNKAKSQLATLRAAHPHRHSSYYSGAPDFENMSLKELNACETFFQSRMQFLVQLSEELRNLKKRLEDLSSGNTNSIMMLFHLALLRKKLLKLDHVAKHLKVEREESRSWISYLYEQLKDMVGYKMAEPSEKFLEMVYYHFDKRREKLAILTEKQQNMENELKQGHSWLEIQSKRLQDYRPVTYMNRMGLDKL